MNEWSSEQWGVKWERLKGLALGGVRLKIFINALGKQEDKAGGEIRPGDIKLFWVLIVNGISK